MNNVKIFVSVIILLAVGIIISVILKVNGNQASAEPGQYDTFASCLTDQGATFYGAFWCSHCQAQKKLFGSSVKFLSYVECSTPDGQAQIQACTDKNIDGYPTWEFADGSRLTGEISLAQLAEKTACPLSPTEEVTDGAVSQ